MRNQNTISTGLIATGRTITLPSPVFNELLESDPQMRLTTPIIPLYEIRNPMDNRVCCSHARRDDAASAAACEWLSGGVGCLLGDGRPCVFDEPDDSVIWQRIREQQRIESGGL